MKTIPIPKRMAHLPLDRRGYPVPVTVFRDRQGRPHFTINEEGSRLCAALEGWCPICGGKLLPVRWFVGGPLSAFDPHGAYIDPPLHRDCMHYALRVCPYLAAPHYGGRIDRSTVPADEPARLYIDNTVMPDRPLTFVAVATTGCSLTGAAGYLRPVRPYRAIEYWRHGRQVQGLKT